jgi:hypothetical protein
MDRSALERHEWLVYSRRKNPSVFLGPRPFGREPSDERVRAVERGLLMDRVCRSRDHLVGLLAALQRAMLRRLRHRQRFGWVGSGEISGELVMAHARARSVQGLRRHRSVNLAHVRHGRHAMSREQ